MTYREHYEDAKLVAERIFGDVEPDGLLALAYALLNKLPSGMVSWAAYDEEDVRQAIADSFYAHEVDAHEERTPGAIDMVVKTVMESAAWSYGELHNGETNLDDLVSNAVWELNYENMPEGEDDDEEEEEEEEDDD